MTRALLAAGSRVAGLCALLIAHAVLPMLALAACAGVAYAAWWIAETMATAMGGALP